MNNDPNQFSYLGLAQQTGALAKFIRDRDVEMLPIPEEPVEELVSLHEAGRFNEPPERFRTVRAGGDGFVDWCPPPVFDHEDGEYAKADFDSLVEAQKGVKA